MALSFLCFRDPDLFFPIQLFQERFVLTRVRLSECWSSGVWMWRLPDSLEESEECDEGSVLPELRWGVEKEEEAGLLTVADVWARKGMVRGLSAALDDADPICGVGRAGLEPLSLFPCLSRFEENAETKRRIAGRGRGKDRY